jgi:flagellar biosynthesis protein FliR
LAAVVGNSFRLALACAAPAVAALWLAWLAIGLAGRLVPWLDANMPSAGPRYFVMGLAASILLTQLPGIVDHWLDCNWSALLAGHEASSST